MPATKLLNIGLVWKFVPSILYEKAEPILFVMEILPVLVTQSGCVISKLGFVGGTNAGLTIALAATLKHPVIGSLCVIE